jgi:hypothetical protein
MLRMGALDVLRPPILVWTASYGKYFTGRGPA